MGVRLGACKIDLSRPVISYYYSLQGDISVVVPFVLCFGVESLGFLKIMYAYWEIASYSAYNMFSHLYVFRIGISL